jgi:hypothetical protein
VGRGLKCVANCRNRFRVSFCFNNDRDVLCFIKGIAK